MSRVADFQKCLKRVFDTPGGRRVLGGFEREADERDQTIARRHVLVTQIERARRVEREEYPRLQAVCRQADGEVRAAREALHCAAKRRAAVGRDTENVLRQAIDDRRSSEGGLRATADPRLVEAKSLLHEAAHQWRHAAEALAQRELHGEFLDAHYVITNREEIDALRTRVHAAVARIDALVLVPEPSEEDIVAAVTEASAAATPILATVRRFFA